jgi:EF hand
LKLFNLTKRYKMKKILLLTAVMLFSSAANAEPHEGRVGGHPHHPPFERLDTNDDGVITKDEAITKCVERFEKMDANGDGKITKDEGRKVRENRGEK